MAATDWTNPEYIDQYLQSREAQAKIKERLKTQLMPETAEYAAEIYRTSPWMSPGVVMSLARSRASKQTVDTVSKVALKVIEEKYQAENPTTDENGQPWWKDIASKAKYLTPFVGPTLFTKDYVFNKNNPVINNPVTRWAARNTGKALEWATPDELKPVSRWAVATSMLLPELIQNSPRFVTGRPTDKENGTWGFGEYEGRAGVFASTTFGTMLGGADQGSGYFPGQGVQKEQGKRARDYRGVINDSAYTFGRGFAYSINLQPGTQPYNYVSGILDGAIAVRTDMTNMIPTKAIKGAVQAARGTERAVTGADTAFDLVMAAFKAGGEVDASLVSADRFMHLAKSNRYVKQMIQRMADTRTPYEVMELFKDKTTGRYLLDIDDAIAISRANSVDEQMGFMAQLFSRRRLTPEELSGSFGEMLSEAGDVTPYMVRTPAGVMPEDIRRLQGARGAGRFGAETRDVIRSYIEEHKLYQWGKRWASESPSSQLLIRGSSKQRNEAVKNYENWLASSKYFDRTELEILQTTAPDLAVNVESVVASIGPDLLDDAARGAVGESLSKMRNIVAGLSATSTKKELQIARTALEREAAKAKRLLPSGAKSAQAKNARQLIDSLGGIASDLPENLSQTRRATLMDKFIFSMSDRYGSAQGAYDAKTALESGIRDILRDNGFTPQAIDEIFKELEESENVMKLYWLNEVGKPGGAGWIKAMIENGNVDPKKIMEQVSMNTNDWDNISIVSPTVVGDLLNNAIILPSVRDLRFKMSPFWSRAITSQGVGGLATAARQIAYVNDIVVSTIWKRLALATGGYIMRNNLDAQLRAALVGSAGGFRTIFTTPVDYIMWSINRYGKTGIDGEDWDDIAQQYLEEGVDVLDGVAREYGENLARAGLNTNLDPDEIMDRLIRSGQVLEADILANREMWTTGIVDMSARIFNDLSMRLALEGVPAEDALRIIKSDPKEFSALRNLWRSEMRGVNARGERFAIPIENINTQFDEVFTMWYENQVAERVKMWQAAGLQDLAIAARFGRTPVRNAEDLMYSADEFMEEYADVIDFALLKADEIKPGDVLPASATREASNDFLVVGVDRANVIDPNGEIIGTIPARYRVVEVNKDPAFGYTADKGSFRLREIISDAADQGLLPQRSLYFRRIEDIPKDLQQIADRGMEILLGWFFKGVSPAVTRRLEKSPFWRQQYYKVVSENVDLLSPNEAQKVLDEIIAKAKEAKVKPEKYVGQRTIVRQTMLTTEPEPRLLDELRAQAARADIDADGTAAQLSEFAGRVANQRMENMFYDAVKRRNYEDAMRAVTPFGGAWRELLTKWVGLMADDPRRIRKIQLAYTGAEKADPEGDGRGFIYTDPATQRKMFMFPGSEEFGKVLQLLFTPGPTIAGALEAPVRQLNVSFNPLPGFGPTIQVAANELLRDKPEFSWLARAISPYGTDRDVVNAFTEGIIPNWAKRLHAVVFGDPNVVDSEMGMAVIDTMRALSVSGEYDLASSQEREKLKRDAAAKARVILLMRFATSIIGPTSGTPTYRFEEDGIDVYADVLAGEFARLREENYDTAVSEFLRIYGDDYILYLASKTESVKPGYEPTEKFMNWQIENQDFLRTFDEVGAYFGPSSDEFSFQAWLYQNEAGITRRLTMDEIIKTAQYIAGNAEYRSFRKQMIEATGGKTNATVREQLRIKREQINKRYPGFPVDAIFTVNKLPNFVKQLEVAVQDPRVADTQFAKDVRTYLKNRDAALAAGNGNLKGASKARLRDALNAVGERLSERNPDFRRLYDRQLAAETEQE